MNTQKSSLSSLLLFEYLLKLDEMQLHIIATSTQQTYSFLFSETIDLARSLSNKKNDVECM